MQRIGSRAQVMHGNAKQTGGGLKKKDLKYNKQGKIVSKKMSTRAKKEKRLQKAGYITKKGGFKLFKKQRGGVGERFIHNRKGKHGIDYTIIRESPTNKSRRLKNGKGTYIRVNKSEEVSALNNIQTKTYILIKKSDGTFGYIRREYLKQVMNGSEPSPGGAGAAAAPSPGGAGAAAATPSISEGGHINCALVQRGDRSLLNRIKYAQCTGRRLDNNTTIGETFKTAFTEIELGIKRTHWVWYIFPTAYVEYGSNINKYFSIQSRQELTDYVNDVDLMNNYMEVVDKLSSHPARIAQQACGKDIEKVRYSLALFYLGVTEHLPASRLAPNIKILFDKIKHTSSNLDYRIGIITWRFADGICASCGRSGRHDPVHCHECGNEHHIYVD